MRLSYGTMPPGPDATCNSFSELHACARYWLAAQSAAQGCSLRVAFLQGANRPSARNISLALTNSPYFKASSQYNSSYLLSALGQLVCESRQ